MLPIDFYSDLKGVVFETLLFMTLLESKTFRQFFSFSVKRPDLQQSENYHGNSRLFAFAKALKSAHELSTYICD